MGIIQRVKQNFFFLIKVSAFGLQVYFDTTSEHFVLFRVFFHEANFTLFLIALGGFRTPFATDFLEVIQVPIPSF